jgi:hypothetical protein
VLASTYSDSTALFGLSIIRCWSSPERIEAEIAKMMTLLEGDLELQELQELQEMMAKEEAAKQHKRGFFRRG